MRRRYDDLTGDKSTGSQNSSYYPGCSVALKASHKVGLYGIILLFVFRGLKKLSATAT